MAYSYGGWEGGGGVRKAWEQARQGLEYPPCYSGLLHCSARLPTVRDASIVSTTPGAFIPVSPHVTCISLDPLEKMFPSFPYIPVCRSCLNLPTNLQGWLPSSAP